MISHRKELFLTISLFKIDDDIENKTFDAIIDNSDYLVGQGLKIIIPSIIIDFYTRLELLIGLKLSGHTDTLTEASNLIDNR